MSTDRTDTDRLNWLVDNGYILELRRIGVRSWTFETDHGAVEGPSFRAAIDKAIDAEAQ